MLCVPPKLCNVGTLKDNVRSKRPLTNKREREREKERERPSPSRKQKAVLLIRLVSQTKAGSLSIAQDRCSTVSNTTKKTNNCCTSAS